MLWSKKLGWWWELLGPLIPFRSHCKGSRSSEVQRTQCPDVLCNWWWFSGTISALISHSQFVWSTNTSLPPRPHNEAPDVPNILPSSRVGAPHLFLLFSLRIKALFWSLTKDNARCPMLTKAASHLLTRRKEEEKRSHYVQTKPRIRAVLEWRVEWAHVLEEVLNNNNNALRGQARNNSGGEKKAFVSFERKGPVRDRERKKWRAEERWGCSIQTGNSSRKSWPAS